MSRTTVSISAKKTRARNALKRRCKNLTEIARPERNRLLHLRLYCIVLIACGFLGLHTQFKHVETVAATQDIVTTDIPITIKHAPLPTSIKIGTLIDQTIEEHSFSVENMPTVSSDRVSYLSSSARPGEIGNVILYGHNKRTILGNLSQVKVGDVITLSTADNQLVSYTVSTAKVVELTDTQWLLQTETHSITIYTCIGWMDSQRFIVRGELIS